MLLVSILEVIMVAIVIALVFNESKVADWEQRMFTKIKSFIITKINGVVAKISGNKHS